jgi:hypothetical protein
MSAVRTIFPITFVIFTGVTLFFPGFPPAALLYEFVRITPSSIGGITIATLINGITNGFFWTTIATTVYGLSQLLLGTRKKPPLPPMPVAPHLAAPLLDNPLVDSRVTTLPPAITVPPASQKFTIGKNPASANVRTRTVPILVSKQPFVAELAVETIPGIGPVYGRVLRILGIETVSDLLRDAATKHAQKRIARQVGVPPETVLTWVYRGDLLRVRGTGKKSLSFYA